MTFLSILLSGRSATRSLKPMQSCAGTRYVKTLSALLLVFPAPPHPGCSVDTAGSCPAPEKLSAGWKLRLHHNGGEGTEGRQQWCRCLALAQLPMVSDAKPTPLLGTKNGVQETAAAQAQLLAA